MAGNVASLCRAADFSAWQRKMKVTFSGYDKTEPLTNFPALVALGTNIGAFSYSDFASQTGGDLRFSDESQAELAYEVDKWDTNGTSHVWVRVPVLTNGVAVWAYWKNPLQTTPPACTTNGAVWSEGYAGVWHLQELTGTCADASGNGNSGTPYGSPNQDVSGKIAGADQFDGVNDYIQCADSASLDLTNQVTVEAWVYLDNLSNARRFVCKGTYSNQGNYFCDMLNNGKSRFFFYNGGWRVATTVSSVMSAGVWQHVVGTARWNGSQTLVSMYVNGVSRSLDTSSFSQRLLADNQPLMFGSIVSDPSYFMQGRMDEVRVSSTARSANWVWAGYMTAASNSAFCTYGTVQTAAEGPVFKGW
jgi:hypothetical protein